jgi:hypothetical protein
MNTFWTIALNALIPYGIVFLCLHLVWGMVNVDVRPRSAQIPFLTRAIVIFFWPIYAVKYAVKGVFRLMSKSSSISIFPHADRAWKMLVK